MSLKKAFSVFVIIIALFLACGKKSGRTIPGVKKGVLDLSGWNFEKDGPIKLDGEWEFHWKKFITPNELSEEKAPNSKKYFITVPKRWKTFVEPQNNKKFGDIGYGTYILKITGLEFNTDKKLAIKTQSIRSAHSLYFIPIGSKSKVIPYKPLIKKGTIAFNNTEEVINYYPTIDTLERYSSENYVIIQTSNHLSVGGGIDRSITLGTERQLKKADTLYLGTNLLMIGIMVMMFFYHLVLFFQRNEDKASFYFSMFCLIIVLRFIFAENFITYFFAIPSWAFFYLDNHLLLFTFYLSVPVLYSFFYHTFQDEFFKVLEIVLWSISLLFSLSLFFSSRSLFAFYYEFICLSIFFLIVICLVKAIVKRRIGSIYSFTGFFILLLFTIHDILLFNGIIESVYLASYGFIPFIFAQSFIISKQFVDAHKRVKKVNVELGRINQLKDEFLSGTSHELRVPLNGMISITESVINGVAGNVSDLVKRNLSIVASSGRRLSSLINDILDFSKLKYKDIALQLKSVDIKSSVDIVIDLLEPIWREKKLSISNLIDPGFPFVEADENRVQQILHNLIGNAIKFTESGEITVSGILLEEPGKKKNHMVQIIISDTGIGIPKDKFNIIFESFEQADESVSREYGGTGIGLSIVRQLIQLHGGEIWVESVIGEGSQFSFTLPVFKSDEASPGSIKKETDIGKSKEFSEYDQDITLENNGKILVVDDDPVNLHIIYNYFIQEDYFLVKA